MLTQKIKDEIITFCDNTDDESVGVVVKKDGKEMFVPFTNISDGKAVHYVAEPQEFYNVLKDTELFEGKDKIVCFVHSHPFGMKNPSGIDIAEAYHNYPYLIYWGEGFTIFKVTKEGVEVKQNV